MTELTNASKTYQGGLSSLVDATRDALGALAAPPKAQTPQDRMFEIYKTMKNPREFETALDMMGPDGVSDFIETMEKRKLQEEADHGKNSTGR